MRLVGIDGTILDLAVDRYQIAARVAAFGSRDWDANWLVVRGRLELPDGRGHAFRDACLTTWEARELGGWLRSVADGELRPGAAGADPDLVFTEPCVALDLEGVATGSVVLRVYLSLEAEPPFVMNGAAGMFANYLRLEITREQLTLGVGHWHRELAAFPIR